MKWLWIALAIWALNALLDELLDWSSWAARRLIGLAARQLPIGSRERWQEEWLAEVEALPGKRISRLVFGMHVCFVVPRMRRELGAPTIPTSMQRALDLSLATIVMFILAPLLAFISLLIRVTLKGPILVRRPRIGLHGREFHLLTFRTRADNRRYTRLSRFLEWTSLDYLPNMINVLRGDMSFVGPPASRRDHVDDRAEKPRPGLVSWEVLAREGLLDAEEAKRRDRALHENWTVRKQLELVLCTLRSLFLRR